MPPDSRISLLCNPISSSPYFPWSPSGWLARFVYWRRLKKGILQDLLGRLYNLLLFVEEEQGKTTLFPMLSSHSDTRLLAVVAGAWTQLGAFIGCVFFSIRKQKEEEVRSHDWSLSESGGLTEISALTESTRWSWPGKNYTFFPKREESTAMFCFRRRDWGILFFFFTKDTLTLRHACHNHRVSSSKKSSKLSYQSL